MSTELRPTPETDAAFLKIYAGCLTHPATIDLQNAEKFARGLERQRDEARESLKRSCDDEHRLNEQVARLTIQRDELLKAARNLVSVYVNTTWSLSGPIETLKEAITAVEGGGK